MNPRDAINFIRSRTGAFLVFVVLLAIALIVALRVKPSLPVVVSKPTPTDAKAQLIERVSRSMSAFKPPAESQSASFRFAICGSNVSRLSKRVFPPTDFRA